MDGAKGVPGDDGMNGNGADRGKGVEVNGGRSEYSKDAVRPGGAGDRWGWQPDAGDESAYVQQHLANERTFLAWIRTGIAIVGVGFLAAGIVFHASPYHRFGQVVAAVVAIGAVLFGGSIFAMATTGYLRKRQGINRESFRSARVAVWGVFTGLCLLGALLLVLIILLLARQGEAG